MDEGNSASAAAGIDGSPILSDFGKIYMYWMAHYRILVIKLFSPTSKRTGVNFDRVSDIQIDYRRLNNVNHAIVKLEMDQVVTEAE